MQGHNHIEILKKFMYSEKEYVSMFAEIHFRSLRFQSPTRLITTPFL